MMNKYAELRKCSNILLRGKFTSNKDCTGKVPKEKTMPMHLETNQIKETQEKEGCVTPQYTAKHTNTQPQNASKGRAKEGQNTFETLVQKDVRHECVGKK